MFNMFLQAPCWAVVKSYRLSALGETLVCFACVSVGDHLAGRPPLCQPRHGGLLAAATRQTMCLQVSEEGLFVCLDLCLVVYSSR